MLKMLVIKSIIFFSILFFINGCRTLNSNNKFNWTYPEKPELKPINSTYFNKGDSITLDHDVVVFDFISSSNLIYNINALNIYISQLELLINTMQNFYENR
jgi:hypothetical protein